MDKLYAVIDAQNVVVNTIMWSGDNDWPAPEGCTAVEVPDGVWVSKGAVYAAGAFTMPSGAAE